VFPKFQQGRVNETAAQARREAVAEQQNAAADYDYYGVPDRTTSFREARDATRRLRVWDEYSPPPVPADIKAEERRKRSKEKYVNVDNNIKISTELE
jgi:hypothetical protein